MATKKRMTTKHQRQTTRKKTTNPRKRLIPRKEQRGLAGREVQLDLESLEIAPLATEVMAAGGVAIGVYREPLSGRPILLATIPITSVQPTPFQRDLSPTHTKRLAQKIGAKTPMTMASALTRMAGAVRNFDTTSVRPDQLALVAAVSGGED